MARLEGVTGLHTRAAGLHTSSLVHRGLAFSDALAALVFPVKFVHWVPNPSFSCEVSALWVPNPSFPGKLVHCESQTLVFPASLYSALWVPNPSFSWEASTPSSGLNVQHKLAMWTMQKFCHRWAGVERRRDLRDFTAHQNEWLEQRGGENHAAAT